jgi:hypothetical protein
VAVSGDDISKLQLWDASTGQPIGLPMVHEGQILGASFTPEETGIFSWMYEVGPQRTSIQFWNAQWRGNEIFDIACNHLPPDHDVSAVEKRYGIQIPDPICQQGKIIPFR